MDNREIRVFYADGECWVSWKDIKRILGYGGTCTANVKRDTIILGLKLLGTEDSNRIITLLNTI